MADVEENLLKATAVHAEVAVAKYRLTALQDSAQAEKADEK